MYKQDFPIIPTKTAWLTMTGFLPSFNLLERSSLSTPFDDEHMAFFIIRQRQPSLPPQREEDEI